MPHKLIFLTALVVCCGIALWRGRDSERWTAVTLLVCALTSPLVQFSRFFQPESGIFLIDMLLLGYLIWLALRSDRFWPIYAAGFQVVGTSIHLARLVDTTILPSAYATAQIFWSYPVLLALAAGTWMEARYRRV